jgi:hypothetical protein
MRPVFQEALLWANTGRYIYRPYINMGLSLSPIWNMEYTQFTVKSGDEIDMHRKATPTMPRKVDHSALRTNLGFIIGFLLLAFILSAPILVGFVALVMLVGTFYPQAALFKQVYFQILKPRGIVKPDVIEDNPEPHNFSQGLGGLFNLAGFLSLVAGASVLGWALAWIVIVLASLNLFAGFCVGCFMYYQLGKRNVRGFAYQPIRK